MCYTHGAARTANRHPTPGPILAESNIRRRARQVNEAVPNLRCLSRMTLAFWPPPDYGSGGWGLSLSGAGLGPAGHGGKSPPSLTDWAAVIFDADSNEHLVICASGASR
jgi:hypothetical protein